MNASEGSGFRRVRSVVALAFVAIVITYVLTALSPLPAIVGRNAPSVASLMSAPSFNFRHTYHEGTVLSLGIGMTRDEMIDALRKTYSESAYLLGKCGGGDLPTTISLQPGSVADVALKRNAVCVKSMTTPLVLMLSLSEDRIAAIEVAYSRLSL